MGVHPVDEPARDPEDVCHRRRVHSGAQSLFEDKELLKAQPVMELGRSSFDSTKPRPSANPFYSDMSLDMAQAFTGTLKGDTPPQQAIADLNSKLERIADVAAQTFDLG